MITFSKIMWTLRLRRSFDDDHQNFFFENGDFSEKDKVLEFANGGSLFLVAAWIEDENHDASFVDPTAATQAEIFDGSSFVGISISKRLFSNLQRFKVLNRFIDAHSDHKPEKDILIYSSLIFLSATLGAFVEDLVRCFNEKRSRSATGPILEIYQQSTEFHIQRYNNPTIANTKELLRQVKLYPEVLDSYPNAHIDELVMMRCKVAHGGTLDYVPSSEKIQQLFNEVITLLSFLTKRIYLKEIGFRSWSSGSLSITSEDSWNFLPFVISDLESFPIT